MGKGESAGNGQSGGNGNALPFWLKYNQEYLMAWQAQYSFWTEQA